MNAPIPVWLFQAAVWLAIAGVALGFGFLLYTFIKEWTGRRLW